MSSKLPVLVTPFLLTALGLGINPEKVDAQVITDKTLGTEQSQIMRIDNFSANISGGARRGGNLFHSFQTFNISEGQSVYFESPVGITSIFSRVTGGDPSRLFGTLGVSGQASLFFQNPSGIIFGPNARLDIPGSLFLSTGNAWLFNNNYRFQSVNPNAPPLLNVNVLPGIQAGQFPQAEIQSFADLSVGGSLTFHGQAIRLENRVISNGDLELYAKDTITIRDQNQTPFVAATSSDLIIQGNNKIDIFALNHPNSGLFSGGNFTLRSSTPIIGDAHYWSRGSFRIETLQGSLGTLTSEVDPVIRSLGDVSFLGYEGASLHIIAAGKVEIPGFIDIVEPDAINGLKDTVNLSDGTAVQIDGQLRRTLDIRAGVDPDVVAATDFRPETFAPLNNLIFNQEFSNGEDQPNLSSTPTSADIIIGDVFLQDIDDISSQVLITNQYFSNNSLAGGDIRVGRIILNSFGAINPSRDDSVTIDSRGKIIFPGDNNSNLFFGERSGIVIDNEFVVGGGGRITLLSQDTILLQNGAQVSSEANGGNGGDILIVTPHLEIQDGSIISTLVTGQGNGGTLKINASESVNLIENREAISGVTGLAVSTTGSGRGGTLEINTANLLVQGGAQISVDTFDEPGLPNLVGGGNLLINASESVLLQGRNIFSPTIIDLTAPPPPDRSPGLQRYINSLSLQQIEVPTVPSGIVTQSMTAGEAGQLTINTPRLVLENRGFIISENQGSGNSSDVTINVSNLILNSGGQIATDVLASGAGAVLKINASESVSVSGIALLDASPSIINARTISSGKGGDLFITTPQLIVDGGGRVATTTFFEGDAGTANINVAGSLMLDGLGSGIFNRTGGEGNAGSLNVEAQTITIQNGARIGVDNFVESGFLLLQDATNLLPVFEVVEGAGNAGNVNIESPVINLLDQGGITAQTTGGIGGNIDLQVQQLRIADSSNISANAGLEETGGNGGNITISATDFILATPNQNNDITANAFTGNGGNISISSPGVFGLTVRNEQTPGSDITASSQAGQNGQVNLNVINPVNGVSNLPTSENILSQAQRIVAGLEQKLTDQVTGFYSKKKVEVPLKSLSKIQAELREVHQKHGIKTALIYLSAPPQDLLLKLPKSIPSYKQVKSADNNFVSEPVIDQLDLVQVAMVTGENDLIRQLHLSDGDLEFMTRLFQQGVLHVRDGVFRQQDFQVAQQWHNLLIAPLEQQLQAEGIDSIVFLLDDGLRSLPLAALHDGERFLIEKYSLSIMPSYSLTDTEYVDLDTTPTLALGTSTFQDLPDLPHVPGLIEYLEEQRAAQTLVDEDFTPENLTRSLAQQSYGVVHLGTHAKFLDTAPNDSFVQFSDQRLKISQISELGLEDANVSLLALSACDTAVGNPDLELGFAGIAHGAGVKSAVASLQEVSDEGTARLMRAFYDHLQQVPFKAEALRRAQVEMLQDKNFQHPYYWAWFTLVGNPW